MNEYGNDTACSNCGDEWSTLDENGHCDECAEAYNSTPKSPAKS